MRNVKVAEFARVRLKFLSFALTFMLAINGVGLLLCMFAFSYSHELCSFAIIMMGLCSISAIALYFGVNKFIEGLEAPIASIEVDRMQMLARLARKFYGAFLISVFFNLLLTIFAVVALIICLGHES